MTDSQIDVGPKDEFSTAQKLLASIYENSKSAITYDYASDYAKKLYVEGIQALLQNQDAKLFIDDSFRLGIIRDTLLGFLFMGKNATHELNVHAIIKAVLEMGPLDINQIAESLDGSHSSNYVFAEAFGLGLREVAHTLYSFGANPNLHDEDDFSSAHVAVGRKDMDGLKFLDRLNTDFEILNAEFGSPIEMAEKDGWTEGAEFMKAAMAARRAKVGLDQGANAALTSEGPPGAS